nr:toll/interleukin-1 receptor domain-containing protein [Rhodobacter sp. SGA-6-6]
MSYAHSDKFFAELLQLKVEASNIGVWRDTRSFRAGDNWRQSIDKGIQSADALILALSKDSSASHYVTYEWATAMAKLKPIIPVLLETCDLHPKLEPLQYMDFRQHSDASWQELIQRIREVLEASEKVDDVPSDPEGGSIDGDSITETNLSEKQVKARDEIKAYLNRMGLRLVSFHIIRKNINKSYDDEFLTTLRKTVSEFGPAKVRIRRPKPNEPKTRDGIKLV